MVNRLMVGKVVFAIFLLCAVIVIASPAQTFKTLVSFSGADGANPAYSLLQGSGGNFYGTTEYGGASGAGTVIEITPKGKLTTLYSFCSQSNCTDGALPLAALIQATNGNFYGTTFEGGAAGAGTIFEITPKGKLSRLYSFCSQKNCDDGSYPEAGLVQAKNGNWYGTTASGGVNGNYGTIFDINAKGKLTTPHSFCSEKGCPDGAIAFGALVRGTNGILYGTTFTGGTDGFGTVFSLSTVLGTP